jgi:hypothetical protein
LSDFGRIYIFATTDPVLANGIVFTDNEKAYIIAFLQMLSDNELIKDKRFSDPQ